MSKSRSLSLPLKGIFVLTVALVVQLSFVMLLALMQRQALAQVENEARIQSTITQLNKISNLWSSLMTDSFRIMIHPKQGDASTFSVRYRAEFQETFGRLEGLVHDQTERKEVSELKAGTYAAISLLKRVREAWLIHDDMQFHEYIKEAGVLGDSCTATSNKLIDHYMNSQQKSQEAQSRSQTLLKLALTIGLSLNFLMVIAIAYLFTREVAHKIGQITDNSFRLTNGLPLHPALPGQDEISRLDQDFHKMASALTEAARKERAVIQNARDLIGSLDAGGRFILVNPASQEILGYTPEELRGKSYLDLVSTGDRERTILALRTLMNGEPSPPFEHSVVKQSGNIVELLLTAHWSETDQSLFCVMHDVSNRRQIERLKQEFTSVITEDLRSPLVATMETLKLIGSGSCDPETGMAQAEAATQQIKPMLKLLANLLEVEKFDAAVLTLDLKPTEVSSIIQEAIKLVQTEAAGKDLVISHSWKGTTIKADKLRLVQALANVLINAIDLSPPGSEVSVKCSLEPSYVRIQVNDNGAPLSQAEQELIFEPFRHDEQQSSKERIERSRLGLAISKSIIEAHKGSIGASNSNAEGNTIWIQLPV